MTQFLADFHFIRPGWLLLIPICLAVWWVWKSRTDRLASWRKQMDADLLAALVVGKHPVADRAALVLLLAWCLAAVAVAGPSWKLEPSPFASDSPPLMLLLKASDSMAPAGMSPTYLEKAQLEIADLAEARKGQPLGLMAYAGSAHLVLPPTKDTDVVAQMASEIGPEIMPVPGDHLDQALAQANQLLEQGGLGGSILVLANSLEMDAAALKDLRGKGTLFPIQILALADKDEQQLRTLQNASAALNASVIASSVDDQDIASIVAFADRAVPSTVAGESSRWQEAGYWLTPLLAWLVVMGFLRQEVSVTSEESP
ncbi:VWA domain-containing protein [Bremerella sp. JC770]|uniref:VWA domain-containing protein n=1 Tax=Bremerella sp. JC770 TaxID=3232137 RepID=UPI003458246D